MRILTDHENHDQSHADQCSPFCVCNCCGAQILTFENIQTFQAAIILEIAIRQEIHYTSPFASSFSGSIWQPPQIA
ncbi:MAG: hypothetical protein EOO50_14655 [Flavobacterium sp.]|nr:MAG: hypothetical protein EOO50_14655 [Flavobacterium sp.]